MRSQLLLKLELDANRNPKMSQLGNAEKFFAWKFRWEFYKIMKK